MTNRIAAALLAACAMATTGAPALNAGAPALPGFTDPPAPAYPDPFELPPLPVLGPNEEKLGHSLLVLTNPTALHPGLTVEMFKDGMVRLDQIILEADADDSTPYGPVNSDLLRVMVRFDTLTPPATPGIVAGPEFYSWTENTDWNVLFGWLETDRLALVAAMPEVISIEASDPPRHRAAGGEGDTVINGHLARAGYGVNGTDTNLGQNVKVGVISDGVTNLAIAQASGDLPGTVNTPLGPGSGDEGTAMLEIVHEIAPGADLYFAPASPDMNAHLNAASTLAGLGCNIIVDDVGWYQEPFFEAGFLGPSLAALPGMYPQQMIFFTAAGNDAETHHQQAYTDGNMDGIHDYLLWVDMPNGSSVDIYLQWDEPQGMGTLTNYDLYLHENAFGTVVWSSTAAGLPRETTSYTNSSGGHQTIHIDIHGVANTGRILEVFIDPKNGATQYVTNMSPVDAIFGHPGDPQIMAVTAVDYTTPSTVEFFASQGPWTQLGGPVGPKPDFTAPDGVSFSGAGGTHLPSYYPATPPPYYFFGTSAAAPHAAAAAALIWSKDLNQPATAVLAALSQSAIDLGLPGPDDVFGAGRIDVLESLIFQYGPPPPTTVTATDGTVGPYIGINWTDMSLYGADSYNLFGSTINDPGTAVLVNTGGPIAPPATTYTDYEVGLGGSAVRDTTMYYWMESFDNRFGTPGEWSAVESGYLQPTNMPPSLSVPSSTFNVASRLPVEVGGLSISDPDAGPNPVNLGLAATMGTLTVDTTVPGGVIGAQVTGNGTANVGLTAPTSALNITLAASDSLLYQSDPAVSGPQVITCTANDLGNFGWGGQMTDTQLINIDVFLTQLEYWQHQQFPADINNPAKQATVWGKGANPDGDAYTNTWEFFMNTDPNGTTPAGQLGYNLTGGNFHVYARVGASINPGAWTLVSNNDLNNASGWTPSGATSTNGPHPDAPADAQLWDLWVPYAPPVDFFRIDFDPDFVEP